MRFAGSVGGVRLAAEGGAFARYRWGIQSAVPATIGHAVRPEQSQVSAALMLSKILAS